MPAINYNIRIEESLRDEAFPVLETYGLTASQAFRLFLNQIAKTKAIPLSFDWEKTNEQKIEQNHQSIVSKELNPTDELLFQVTGIRPLPNSKHLVTDEMVNQIREQEGI